MATMTTDAHGWDRLATLVQRAREVKGLSQSAAAAEAGIDRGSWAKIEKATGARPQGTTLAAVERVLGWRYGSAQKILAGGEPLPVEVAAQDPPIDPDVNIEVVRRWARTSDNLTDEEREQVLDYAKWIARIVERNRQASETPAPRKRAW